MEKRLHTPKEGLREEVLQELKLRIIWTLKINVTLLLRSRCYRCLRIWIPWCSKTRRSCDRRPLRDQEPSRNEEQTNVGITHMSILGEKQSQGSLSSIFVFKINKTRFKIKYTSSWYLQSNSASPKHLGLYNNSIWNFSCMLNDEEHVLGVLDSTFKFSFWWLNMIASVDSQNVISQ